MQPWRERLQIFLNGLLVRYAGHRTDILPLFSVLTSLFSSKNVYRLGLVLQQIVAASQTELVSAQTRPSAKPPLLVKLSPATLKILTVGGFIGMINYLYLLSRLLQESTFG